MRTKEYKRMTDRAGYGAERIRNTKLYLARRKVIISEQAERRLQKVCGSDRVVQCAAMLLLSDITTMDLLREAILQIDMTYDKSPIEDFAQRYCLGIDLLDKEMQQKEDRRYRKLVAFVCVTFWRRMKEEQDCKVKKI